MLKLNKFIILVTLVYTYSYMRYLEVCYEKKPTSSLNNIQYYVLYMFNKENHTADQMYT